MYILKTKIDNALTQIETYSTSVLLVKYVIKNKWVFVILKVSDPHNNFVQYLILLGEGQGSGSRICRKLWDMFLDIEI